jgi:hypothetical protein
MPSIFSGCTGTVIVLETRVNPTEALPDGYDAGPPSWGPACIPTQRPPLHVLLPALGPCCFPGAAARSRLVEGIERIEPKLGGGMRWPLG